MSETQKNLEQARQCLRECDHYFLEALWDVGNTPEGDALTTEIEGIIETLFDLSYKVNALARKQEEQQ